MDAGLRAELVPGAISVATFSNRLQALSALDDAAELHVAVGGALATGLPAGASAMPFAVYELAKPVEFPRTQTESVAAGKVDFRGDFPPWISL